MRGIRTNLLNPAQMPLATAEGDTTALSALVGGDWLPCTPGVEELKFASFVALVVSAEDSTTST